MKPLSLYIDNSVIGGYFDPEFTVATRELWRQMEKGQYRFYASSISVGEVARAPDEVRAISPIITLIAPPCLRHRGGLGGLCACDRAGLRPLCSLAAPGPVACVIGD